MLWHFGKVTLIIFSVVIHKLWHLLVRRIICVIHQSISGNHKSTNTSRWGSILAAFLPLYPFELTSGWQTTLGFIFFLSFLESLIFPEKLFKCLPTASGPDPPAGTRNSHKYYWNCVCTSGRDFFLTPEHMKGTPAVLFWTQERTHAGN